MHVDLVVVGGVQRRGGRRGHPGGVGAGPGMADLLLQHGGHQVGHRPHALADLGMAGQPAFQPGVDVPCLVGGNPGGLLHVALADHRAGFHRGVDLVAGAVEEAGVDEDDALPCGADALLEVDGGAPLLVHDADLDGVRGHAERLLDAAENLDGERDLVRPVHLRLDDIDRAGAGIGAAAGGPDVVQGGQRRHHRVHDAFRHLVAVAVEDRRIGHEVADIAHQHQRAAGQRQRAAVRRGVGAVGVEPSRRNALPPLAICSTRSPFIRPSQLR